MSFVTQDKFGNDRMVVGLKDKKGNGFPKGFAKIGGKLFKIEYSESNKEGVEGWVTITKTKKRNTSNSF